MHHKHKGGNMSQAKKGPSNQYGNTIGSKNQKQRNINYKWAKDFNKKPPSIISKSTEKV